MLSDIQQNMLPLTFGGHLVGTNREASKYSLYIEL